MNQKHTWVQISEGKG